MMKVQGTGRVREKKFISKSKETRHYKNNGNDFITAYVAEASVSNWKLSRLSALALYLIPVTQQSSTNTMLGVFPYTM